jgi:hypothetical protein
MSARPLPERFLVAFSFGGEQRELVRSIAEAVESRLGVGTVFLDEWFEHYLAGADADLKLQEIYGVRSALAVVCVSERYGGKPWTQAEHEAIRARMMRSRGSSDTRARASILPVRVGDGDVPGILFNVIAPDVRERTAEEAAQIIIERLQLLAPAELRADSSWPEAPPDLVWSVTGHGNVREVFATLLTRDTPWRFLPLRGPTETGKSRITNQMLTDALEMPDIVCARFDFKGAIDMDAEVRTFAQQLGVPLPPTSASINERLGQILGALVERERPALLIFDTYEAAGQAQRDWVEKELLIQLIRTPLLRVVIAGKTVPESVDIIWSSVAHAAIDLKPPSPSEWFAYGKQYRPDLTLEEVETACRLTKGKPSLLAQLLGPAT